MSFGIEPNSLSALLGKEGYTSVPLRESGVGHLYADGKLAGRDVDVLVDTGASHTVIDRDLAIELRLALTPSTQAGAGIGDARASAERIGLIDLTVGTVQIPVDAYAMDLSNIRNALALRGILAPSVVLGADALRMLDAVLLYRAGSLYLRPSVHDADRL